ncbi:MAG: cell wall-active antibiotics response protein [Ignavibacteriales bacterium]|nr:cell wall-active antibiotics response protein [Ignavibacteriales bacterium]
MRNLFWGIVFITFGVLFLLDNLGYADISEIIHDYWPLILIIWGFSILTRSKSRHRPPQVEITQQSASDVLHQSNIFGDLFTKIISQNFKGGSINTVFGDCEIDLSGSSFAEGEHELKIHGVFGDSFIILPKDAPVSITASSVFGDLAIYGQQKSGFSADIQYKTPSYSTTDRRMKIIITKVFGDIRVE